MFRLLVLQTLYTLSHDQAEYQVRDRLSFMRFVGLGLGDPVPDAKTLWLFREQLTRAGAVETLLTRFDRLLRAAGYLAMGEQIVDATVVEARRPRLKGDEKATVKGGVTPESWSKAKAAQIDRDGRWTLKRGRKRPPKANERVATELVVPSFGYTNHVAIDRRHGFVRRYTVTHAAAHDGAQLAAVLDPDNTASRVWADTAYRSKENLAMLARADRAPAAAEAAGQADGAERPPWQCQAGARPGRRRAHLRRAEAPPGSCHPHCRRTASGQPLGDPGQGPCRDQARSRQPPHQHAQARLVRDPNRARVSKRTIPKATARPSATLRDGENPRSARCLTPATALLTVQA
jgi:IS5 family transposase